MVEPQKLGFKIHEKNVKDNLYGIIKALILALKRNKIKYRKSIDVDCQLTPEFLMDSDNLNDLSSKFYGLSFIAKNGLFEFEGSSDSTTMINTMIQAMNGLNPSQTQIAMIALETWLFMSPNPQTLSSNIKLALEIKNLQWKPILEIICYQFDFKMILSSGPNCVEIILKLAKFIFSHSDKSLGDTFVNQIIANFNSLTTQIRDGGDVLPIVFILRYAIILDRNNKIRQNKPVLEWIINKVLNAKVYNLKVKKKALDLLNPYLKDPSFNERLETCLNRLSDAHFPLESVELIDKPNQLRDYTKTFSKLSASLVETKSTILLKFLITTICRESSHIYLDSMKLHLEALMKNGDTGEQLELLNVPLEYFKDTNFPYVIRQRILNQFLLPILNQLREISMTRWYSSEIGNVLDLFVIPVAEGSEDKRLTNLVSKTGACKILSVLYANVSRDKVHSQGAQIPMAAYKWLVAKGHENGSAPQNGKELSKYLVKKLTSARSELTDGSEAIKETLRIYHCESYNTIIKLISCIQDQEKFYNNFIFKEKDQLIWTRIIDTDSAMNLPLVLDLVTKKKTLNLGKSSNSSSATQGVNNNRHYLFDSSLSQEITSFDFTSSIGTINPSGYVPSNSRYRLVDDDDESFENEAIEIESDALNNHENMETMMKLLNHMKNKKIFSSGGQGGKDDQEEEVNLPPFMETLKNVLSSNNYHPNIKLFILRLILNMADIFKPFAKHFLKVFIFYIYM